MVKAEKHIIHKVYLEVNTTSREQGFYIKDRLDMFLKTEVFPQIESYFEGLETKLNTSIIRIDKLDLDLKVNNEFRLEELKEIIIQNVKKVVEQKIENSFSADSESEIFLTNDSNNVQAFFYFLEKGTAPWWKKEDSYSFLVDEEVLKEVINGKGFRDQFLNKIKSSMIRRRLILQFSDETIKEIVIKVFKESNKSVNIDKFLDEKEFLTSLEKVDPTARFDIWESIINFYETKDREEFYKKLQLLYVEHSLDLPETIKSWINILSKAVLKDIEVQGLRENLPYLHKADTQNDTSKSVESADQKEDIIRDIKDQEDPNSLDNVPSKVNTDVLKELVEEDEYYFENAGLILLHPFLKHFFEHCKLLDEQGDILDQELAIHLLHYIATKKQKQPEHLMVFEKFLCDVPIHQPIARHVELSQRHLDQAEDLLAAVLSNWGALKNSSPDLLRNEFLQRAGKLVLKEDNPKIIIERKTQDILLDRIPWNISIIKLPWKDQLIFVDW